MLKKSRSILAGIACLGLTTAGMAQEGHVTINQDEILPELLQLKAEMVKDSRIAERYRIQIFSGEFEKATTIKKDFEKLYPEIPVMRQYETPNYKIWAGNFRTSLEADRALLLIKKDFPAAFRFRPEKK